MACQIIVKKHFTNRVQKVLACLEKEWSHKAAVEFLIKIDRRIKLLVKQPHVGVLSSKIKDIGGLMVTRHNRLYYKIKGNKVIILNMYDTKINPKRNPYQAIPDDWNLKWFEFALLLKALCWWYRRCS